MIPQPLIDQHIYQSFIMVSSIPRTVAGNESNISCGDMNVAPWGSFYPVYSVKSKQIYKNIECAEEDDEDSDVILWDAVINCRNLKKAVNGIDSISEVCDVNFFFPGDLSVLQHLHCYTGLIDTCPESYDFQVPEGTNVSKEEIRKLCESSGILSPYRARKIYANVFCHICNEAFFHGRSCSKDDTNDYGARVGHPGEFIALIDGEFMRKRRDAPRIIEQMPPLACHYADVSFALTIYSKSFQNVSTKNDINRTLTALCFSKCTTKKQKKI